MAHKQEPQDKDTRTPLADYTGEELAAEITRRLHDAAKAMNTPYGNRATGQTQDW
ncbi:hypothetical protein H0264_21360 [Nocardia huaxiensis]|uniref:Uncharacterized protein n=1 Tax=Nocardia huaxiensis TaxID=2755382 RepID=A0A7D6Z6H4_9NOCA|nr:hypothetical protein [Nocardia huaxiensis]QLY27968.1 hypothetical protein H0264_21360 [Nocardia huaxiensis]